MDDRLTLHRVDIVKDLEPKKHWNYLIQERVLNDDDLEELKAEKTRKARAELLIAKVLRAGRQNIDVFVNCLRIYQPHLYELLQSNLPERLQRQQGNYIEFGNCTEFVFVKGSRFEVLLKRCICTFKVFQHVLHSSVKP